MAEAIECLVDAKCALGESPVWDEAHNRLLWADIDGAAIHVIELDGGRTSKWQLPGKVGSFGLCESDRLVVGLPNGVHLFDPASGEVDLLVDPEPERPTNRLNDGKVGPDGAFWVGSMDDRPDKEPVAALHRVTADGNVECKVDDLTVSNGLAWSGDGKTMFHSDSRGGWIDRYDCDPASGSLSDRTRIAELTNEQGRPDGAAVDVEGAYWSCGVSAGVINRFSRDGALLEKIPLPVPTPTMCCFGGPDMKTLFITSLRVNVAPEILESHPFTGGILTLQTEIEGAPVGRFRA